MFKEQTREIGLPCWAKAQEVVLGTCGELRSSYNCSICSLMKESISEELECS